MSIVMMMMVMMSVCHIALLLYCYIAVSLYCTFRLVDNHARSPSTYRRSLGRTPFLSHLTSPRVEGQHASLVVQRTHAEEISEGYCT